MSIVPDLPGGPAWLAWLPRFLFSSQGPAWRYVLKAWPLALIPSFALGILFGWLLPDLPRPDFPTEIGMPLLLFLLVVFSPVVETLILAPIVLVLQRLFGGGVAVVAAAPLWAGAHSLQAAAWGLVVWWPFLIMGIALLAWRERGLARALGVVIAIHALQNAAAAALLFAGPR